MREKTEGKDKMKQIKQPKIRRVCVAKMMSAMVKSRERGKGKYGISSMKLAKNRGNIESFLGLECNFKSRKTIMQL